MTRAQTTDEWGIDATWRDALDVEHEVSAETIAALRARHPAILAGGTEGRSARS